jgi:hypothetical protein
MNGKPDRRQATTTSSSWDCVRPRARTKNYMNTCREPHIEKSKKQAVALTIRNELSLRLRSNPLGSRCVNCGADGLTRDWG